MTPEDIIQDAIKIDAIINRGHNGGPSIKVIAGFIMVSRGLQFHPIVGFGKEVSKADPSQPNYHKVEAWLDLLLSCNYRDGLVWNGRRAMVLRRGQVIGGISWLADRWNWTPKTVRTFLEDLENADMIGRMQPTPEAQFVPTGVINADTTHRAHKSARHAPSSIIDVKNYDKYQGDREETQADMYEHPNPEMPGSRTLREQGSRKNGISGSRKGSRNHEKNVTKTTDYEELQLHQRQANGQAKKQSQGQANDAGTGQPYKETNKVSLLENKNTHAREGCIDGSSATEKKTVEDLMIDDLVEAMGGPKSNAEKWLVGTLGAYGRDATIAAWTSIQAERMAGKKIIALPRYWSNVARAIKDKSPTGTRLSTEWALPKSWGDWAKDKFKASDASVRDQAAKFKNHWSVSTTTNAVKTDWRPAWENWCLTAWPGKDSTPASAEPKKLKPHPDRATDEEIVAYMSDLEGGRKLLGYGVAEAIKMYRTQTNRSDSYSS